MIYAFTCDELDAQGQPTGAGRLTTVTEPGRTVKLAYHPSGRLRSETATESGVPTPLVTGYEYDADGTVDTMTYPSGLRVKYDRDQATREVWAVRNPDTGTVYVGSVIHARGGPVTSLTYGNGKTLSQTFDLRYQPSALASGPLLLGYGMTPAGDVERIDDSSQVLSGCYRNTFRELRYDFLDRLTESPGWLSYGYDGGGNRTSETVEGAAASYVYAAGTDRVSKELVAGVARYALGYDRQANLSAIGKYDSTGTSIQSAVCLRHDALGRMVLYGARSVSGVSPDATLCTSDAEVTSAVARFRYDARNRRIARQEAATGQWTHTVFDPSGNPLSELSLVAGSWVKVRDYVWLDGKPLAQVEYPTPTTSYVYSLHLDHIGLPRAMTNQAGQLIWTTFPRPYGDIAEKTTTDPLSGRVVVTNLRLPGQYDERLLGSLGLQGPYYNWNRWYLPGVGRYLELDRIERTGGLNGRFYTPDWYTYAASNPLTYTDPRGFAIWLCSRSSHNPPVGNHAYLWDDRTETSCGMNASSSSGEGGTSPFDQGPFVDSCVRIAGSEDKEDQVMNCCRQTANRRLWAPWISDCHTAAGNLLYRTEGPVVVLLVAAFGATIQGWLLGPGVRILVHTILSFVAFAVLLIAFGYAAHMPFLGGCLVFAAGAGCAGALQAKGFRETRVGPFAAILFLGGGMSFLLLGSLVGANRSLAFAVFAAAMGVVAAAGTHWSVRRYSPPSQGGAGAGG